MQGRLKGIKENQDQARTLTRGIGAMQAAQDELSVQAVPVNAEADTIQQQLLTSDADSMELMYAMAKLATLRSLVAQNARGYKQWRTSSMQREPK